MRRSLLTVLAFTALLFAGATAVHAQGSFYREVAKDGRIYVFNTMQQYVDWEKSGEMGVGITLLAYGPNGETMVFDSEEAIHLYNYKHDRPGDPRLQPPAAPKPSFTWKDGATTFLFPGLAQVKVSNRVQLRYTHEMPDDAVTLGGAAGPGDSRGSFRIRRAKTKVDGWFHRPWLLYEMQLNWPAVTGSNPGAFLEDANINWDLTKGERAFMVKFGQFKVPFGQQELTSSGSQQFVDRSVVSNQYARGRDMGVQLWGRLLGDRVEWRAGVFNGNGLTRTTNDNDTFQYNARILFQPNHLVPLANGLGNSGALFSEADFESTDKPIYAVAFNFEKNDFFRTTSNVDLKDTVWGFDGIFKFKGFSATGAWFKREREPEASATAPGVSFDSDGWFAQAGYLIGARRRWEVAGRYGTYDPTSLAASNDQTELRGGVSYYDVKHALKVQADLGQTKNKANGQKAGELRLQTQFLF